MKSDIKFEILEIKNQLNTQKKTVKFLLVGWLATISFGVLGASYSKTNFFQELRVGRLALVDENGIERVILVNDSDTVRVNGKTYPRKPVSTGIIFQNERGDEISGWAMGDNGHTVFMLDGYSNLTSFGESERVGLVSLADGTAGLYLMDLTWPG